MAAFLCVGISHKEAPIAVREQVAIAGDELPARLRALQALPGVSELVVLSTCNRLELFASVESNSAGSDLLDALGPAAAPHARVLRDEAALRHLFRVAASLESMVIGEAQILGQLKEAWALAQEQKVSGARLAGPMSKAIAAAKRVRTETAIARGALSISSVAVEMAHKALGDLRGSTVVLLGAGEMAQLAARELQASGAKELIVVNRSAARAEELAREVGGIPSSLPELPALLERADVCICSTGASTPIVTHAQMSRALKARRYRALFLVDLALPRNVEAAVNQLENVFVYDLDDLESIAAQNRDVRAGEAEQAAKIIEDELQAFLREQRERAGTPVLARLRAQGQAIAEAEVARTLAALEPLDDKQQKSLRAMAQAIVNKLLHSPTQALRAESAAGQSELADAASRLFELAENDSPKSESSITKPSRDESSTSRSSTGEASPGALVGNVLPLERKGSR